MDDLIPAIINSAELQSTAQASRDLLACNTLTERYGLTITPAEAEALVRLQQQALQACGLFGIGSGILPTLARTFCDSPFVGEDNYAVTLSELQQVFYYFRRETAQFDVFQQPSDEELCDLLAYTYDAVAGGSMEYLSGTLLEMLLRAFKRSAPKKELQELKKLFLEDPVPVGITRTLDKDWFAEVILGEGKKDDDVWL